MVAVQAGDVHDELEHFLQESDNGVSKNSAWAASELRKEDVGSSEVDNSVSKNSAWAASELRKEDWALQKSRRGWWSFSVTP